MHAATVDMGRPVPLSVAMNVQSSRSQAGSPNNLPNSENCAFLRWRSVKISIANDR